MSTLVVIDGPNLLKRVGQYLAKTRPSSALEEIQKAYYRHYFDIDRLVASTLGDGRGLGPFTDLGSVIFHSCRAFGPPNAPYAIREAHELSNFWMRQGGNPNTATMPVDVGAADGEESEDRGTSMSIAVHLFETIQSWETAVIFSNDTELVPAIWSLRRRGKRVHCATLDRARTSPIAAACQHFIPLNTRFLDADRALFECLYPGGALDVHAGAALEAFANLPNGSVLPMKAPTLAMSGRTLTIGPIHDVDVKQRLDSHFRGAGVFEVGETEGGPAIRVTTHAETIEGMERHAPLFAAAKWLELLPPAQRLRISGRASSWPQAAS